MGLPRALPFDWFQLAATSTLQLRTVMPMSMFHSAGSTFNSVPLCFSRRLVLIANVRSSFVRLLNEWFSSATSDGQSGVLLHQINSKSHFRLYLVPPCIWHRLLLIVKLCRCREVHL